MRGVALVFFAGIAVVVVAFAGAGNSGGAPEGAAEEGCTCHAPEPNPAAEIVVEGLPDHYVKDTRYEVTVRIEAAAPALPPPAGQNQGGFAVLGDAKWGKLEPVDDTTQLTADEFLTHTEAGNDAREWRFAWTSVDKDFEEFQGITFHISANAVNGNGLPDPLDAWTHAERFFEATHPMEDPFGHLDGEGGNSTAETTTSDAGTPGLGTAGLLVGVVAAVVALRRRDSR